MPLATGLASAFDTFTGVSNQVRSREQHNAQMEGHRLRNEGQRLNNQFAEDTYDRRVKTVESKGLSSDFRAESDRIGMQVAAAVAPWTVHKAEFDARGSEQSFYTEQQRTRSTAAQARSRESAARTAEATEHSNIYATNAKNWNEVEEIHRAELGRVQEDIAHHLEAENWDMGAINHNPTLNGELLGMARAAGYDVSAVTYDQGGVHFFGGDEERPIQSLSEPEFVALISDSDGLSEAMRGTTEARRMHEQLQGQFEAGSRQISGDHEAARQEYEDSIALFSEVGPALSDLQNMRSQYQALEEKRAELRSGPRVPGRRSVGEDGEMTSTPSTRVQLAEAEKEKEALGEQIATLERGLSEQGLSPELVAQPDRLQDRIQRLESFIPETAPDGPRVQSLRTGIEGEAREIRDARSMGLSLGDAEHNLRATGSATRTPQQQAEAEEHGMRYAGVVDDVVKMGGDIAREVTNTLPSSERTRDMGQRATEIENDIARVFAINPDLAEKMGTDPNARARISSVIRDAATLQRDAGHSTAISVLGAIRRDDPRVVEAMHDVANDTKLVRNLGLSDEDQLRLASMVGEHMQQQLDQGSEPNVDRAVNWAAGHFGQ